jgi:hypothetical protein
MRITGSRRRERLEVRLGGAISQYSLSPKCRS